MLKRLIFIKSDVAYFLESQLINKKVLSSWGTTLGHYFFETFPCNDFFLVLGYFKGKILALKRRVY
jgi:hypothetical protein